MEGPRNTGGQDDPVARNIRREQNAAAAPSQDEIDGQHERYLEQQGCVKCDESNPENLQLVRLPTPDIAQTQGDPDVVVCDRHYTEVVEDARQKAEKADKELKERRRKQSETRD